MPVKIRLTRMGKKKQPTYRVVVVDSRKPRDGAYIEQIGRYDPRQDPSLIEIDNDRALDWLLKGAQPTERAKKLLEISGAWTRFRVDKGDIHTIDSTPVREVHVIEDTVPDTVADAAVTEAVVEEAVEAEAAVVAEAVVEEAVAEVAVEEVAAEEAVAEVAVEEAAEQVEEEA